MENNFYSLAFPAEFYNFQGYETSNYFLQCLNCQNLINQDVLKKNSLEQLSLNLHLAQQKNEKLQKENQGLKTKLALLEDQRRKKRIVHRRNQTELQKISQCPYTQCQKLYASDVALNLHLKLKHKGGTKKQRQAFAKKIILAQKRNLPQPSSRIILPPNYLQSFKRDLLLNLNKFDAESEFFCSQQIQ